MRIQHNIMAMSAYRNYTNNVSAMQKNLEKLSSGYKINRAGDDAAGLAISEKMRAQITGLETAQKNAKDGISLVQTAEGALTEVHDMLNRMVELATQSANGTYDNETDRAQMQKEVDQLLEEINRIADSSNFNGINLLDGTLGMNTEAFTVSVGDEFKAATDPKAITLGSAVLSDYHGGESVTGQAPKFTIDLNDLEVQNTGTATGTVAFTITGPGGFEINVSCTGISAGAKATIGAITTAIASALASQNTASATGVFMIGSLAMKASAAGGKINFTYWSTNASATAAGSWSTDVSGSAGKALAEAFNAAVFGSGAGAVTVTASAGADTSVGPKGVYTCNITAVADAVADAPAERPGISIDISSLVQDGYKLKIADGTGSTATTTTYIFKTDKNSTYTAGAGEKVIDVSMVAASQQAKQAALMIAGSAATGNTGNAAGVGQTAAGIFTVSLKGDTTIHIDVTNASKAGVADSEEKMKKLISAEDAGTQQTPASTKLTVTASKITDNNVLKIGSKSYTFKKGDTLDDVKNAIGADYDVTVGTGTQANVLTISAKNATASTAAPVVLGKGLTLQIGDTADDYNQLNVAVKDCHASSLGIGGLKIDTEEAAQAAIDKIKAAVNYVSDVRGTLGATQNRLDHTINNLSVMTENIQDAESTIRDVDVAEEMMAYTKNNILIQASQAMLAQANQVPQGVLQLLQ